MCAFIGLLTFQCPALTRRNSVHQSLTASRVRICKPVCFSIALISLLCVGLSLFFMFIVNSITALRRGNQSCNILSHRAEFVCFASLCFTLVVVWDCRAVTSDLFGSMRVTAHLLV